MLEGCLSAKADQDSFSGVISVAQHGHTVATIARGVLAGAGSPSITATTRFNIGSTSKMFTAVAVGQLVDAGKVKFDEPIGTYVAGLTPEASAVTVRQLLTHSSGLGDFFQPQNMEAMMKARTASDILPLIAADKPAFTPGSKFAYSNSGFALLGILIERASGQTYGDYLRTHVFKRAGMINTGLDPNPLTTLAVGMTGHQPGGAGPSPSGTAGGRMLIGPDGKQLAPGMAPPSGAPEGGLMLIGPDGKPMASSGQSGQPGSAGETLQPAPGATEGYGSPAGGMFSTVTDMQKFATALMSNGLTSAATTTALTSAQIIAAPATDTKPERTYGFGFSVGTEAGKKWFGHNGGTLGANAEFAVFPNQQWTLTVLSNRDPPTATNMFKYLRALLTSPDALATCGSQEGTEH
jgi:CubicO group peptidase (beta-lactamase class C family)